MSHAVLFHFICDQLVLDFHHQEIATILLNYHIGRVELCSMCTSCATAYNTDTISKQTNGSPKHIEQGTTRPMR